MSSLIVIPTYNECENIEPLITEILALEEDLHLLVVDDNSPDGTGEIIQRMAAARPEVHLVARPGKLGLGTAYGAGFTYGLERGYERMVTMDADFSHQPRYLPDLLRESKGNPPSPDPASQPRSQEKGSPDLQRDEGTFGLVIGSRYIPGGGTRNWGRHRKVLSWGANQLARRMLGLTVHDCTSGFRCYTPEALRRAEYEQIGSSGYSYLVEMLYRCCAAGVSVQETPIIFVDRERGQAKMSKAEIVKGWRTLVRLHWKFSSLRGQKITKAKCLITDEGLWAHNARQGAVRAGGGDGRGEPIAVQHANGHQSL
jgi:dolichol-phosphate mannosyltransferase